MFVIVYRCRQYLLDYFILVFHVQLCLFPDTVFPHNESCFFIHELSWILGNTVFARTGLMELWYAMSKQCDLTIILNVSSWNKEH